MATSCYGQHDHEISDLDGVAAPGADDAAPAARGPGEVPAAGARAPADEPKLAIGQMKVSIEDGLVMVFGPEGDPVPPHVVAGAAAEQPDAVVALADGTAVVARRLAMVLQAQARGRLGPAEHGDWITTMLLGRDSPGMASEEDLRAEQEPGAVEGHGDRLRIATPSGSFLITDAGPARTGEVTGLFLPDGTPISVAELTGLLRERRGESGRAIDAPGQATVTAGDIEACDRELDLSSSLVEFDADGVWLESLALAAVGGRIRLARWATDAPNGPVVRVSPAGGETASLGDLCAALGIAHEVAADHDPSSGIDDPVTPKDDWWGSFELDPTSGSVAREPHEESGRVPPDIASTVPALPPLELDPAPVVRPDQGLDLDLPDALDSLPALPRLELDPAPVMTDQSGLDLDLPDALDSLPDLPDGLVTDAPEEAFLTAVDWNDGSGTLKDDLPDQSLPDPASASGDAALTGPPIGSEPSQATTPSATAEEAGAATGPAAPLSSDAADIDPESIVLVVVRGVPDDARLSAGIRDDDGSWSLSSLDLPSVTITLAEGTDDAAGAPDGELIITGIALGEDGALAAFSETVPLADYLADPLADKTVDEPAPGAALDPARDRSADPRPRAIALAVDPGIWHGDAYDALVIRNVPAGAGLSAGAYDPAIDGWVLRPRDLEGLTIRPPADRAAGFTLTLMGVVLRPGEPHAARILARLPVALATPAPGSSTARGGDL